MPGGERRLVPFVVLLALAGVPAACGADSVGGAGGERGHLTGAVEEPDPGAPPSSRASGAPPAAGGMVVARTLDCTTFDRPASLQVARSTPPTLCAFASDDATVSVRISPGITSLETASLVASDEAGRKTTLTEIEAGDWTFAARWPATADGMVREARWMVASGGLALECRTGSRGNAAAHRTLLDVCRQARDQLYTGGTSAR